MSKFYSRTNRILLALLWVFCATGAFAQQRTVTGSVKDETGSPLPGVSILVVGTSNGTVSDVDGKFSIQVGSDARLQFAYVGYEVQVVEVGQNTVLDVSLAVDVKTLTEVVVTGYASQQKKDLTGSVGTVKVAELTQVPSNNVTNQLQGRIAGVTVSGDGRPGNPAKVRIRGFGSFQNNDPLYIVDGVPTQDISTINPNDIESLSVLKDAGAASIYGSRASNGVIIVTTKKGQRKGVKVNYDMFVGSVSPGKSPDFLLNAQEYADLQWLVYRNDGTNETHPVYGPSSAAKPSFPAWAGDTDWYDAVTRQGSMASHDISMSGGNESAKFYAGLQYFNQNGIALGNFQQRFSARINSEFKIKDRVTIGENLTVTGRTGNQVSGNGTEESPVARVYMTQPIIPVRVNQVVVGSGHTFQPGEYGGTGLASRLGSTPNPVADLERAADNRQQDIRILGSIFADVKILEHLKFRTTFGGTFGSNYNTSWTNKTYERAENQATSSYFESAGYGSDWVWTNQLTYDKTFGNHKLLAVAGYEAVKYGIGRGLSAGRAGYFSSAFSFRTVSNGAQILSANSGLGTPTTLLSQFVRADYSFSDKYLLSATVRRDGSSRFGADF
ncbi:MAG: SusC/RagA family TonB-linked outer membrane protein, partial [Cyclobacteriaceae bacterium]